MKTNVHQNAAFVIGVERFNFYVIRTNPEAYDSKRVKDIIDSFGSVPRVI